MTRAALDSLALSMLRQPDQSPIPIPLLIGHPPPPVAVTYFGQFVDHDLTGDATPLREAGSCEPSHVTNHRTPWLDLDHLYGDGPGSLRHGHLYASDGASFRLGYSPFGGEPFDVPCLADGAPALVEERNGENLIVRQVHAMFLKLHNRAVDALPIALPPAERFDRARDRVRWQYQWLVRNWFLKEVCDPLVYEAVVVNGQRLIDWQQDGFSIPVEFAVGAMRFGHSMVRDGYTLNNLPAEGGGSGFVPLGDLFGLSHIGLLPPRLKVDWALLSRRGAMAIDTAMVAPLFQLPDDHLDLYVRGPIPHPPRSLALRTLLRGAAMHLPTGQQIRQAFKIARPISPTSPLYKEDPWQHLGRVNLTGDTPLWYYVLIEAQLDRHGCGLGEVGSRLVAEVIEGSLEMDAGSYVRRQPRGWEPPPWETPRGIQVKIGTLLDLARVTGLAD